MFESPTPTSKHDWPHDQRYAGICRECQDSETAFTASDENANPPTNEKPLSQFYGPKRAPSCWMHASDDTREWWLSHFARA